MIEVIYSGETREPKAQEKGILAALKNIRQIGSAGKTTRIYVEDCVMGFLERQMEKKDPVVAALLGKESQENGVTFIFISGALLPKGIKVKGDTLNFSSEAFLDMYKTAEQYFPKLEILGWYLPAYEMIGKYGGSLGENSRVFLLEDPTESEELFYLWEQNRLTKQGGYYIYYQRNEEMKNYMQSLKEKAEKPFSQRTDRVNEETEKKESQEITWKEAIKTAFEKKNKDEFVDDYEEMTKYETMETSQPKLTTFLYGASTVLAIVVLVIGITLVNNYEKMYEMQEAIETIAMTIKNEENKPIETYQPEIPEEENTIETSDTGQNQQEPDPIEEEAEEPVEVVSHESYVIQEGDTLASISRKIYQTTDKIEEIKQLNPEIKENELIVGEKIVLP